MQHITVLRREAVDALALASDSVVVDCTLGSGGHTNEILARLGKEGRVIALDADRTAIAAAEGFIGADDRVTLVNANFRNLSEVLEAHGLREVDAILADLGWRTEQFEAGEKGFSFTADEPLLMTYGDPKDYLFTARDIVNDWEEESISNVIFGYSEERFARRIAQAIVSARATRQIETARELAEIIADAVPSRYRNGRIHPATKTFQSLRIAVNDELLVLEQLLETALASLSPEGRLAIITFHSIEDRIVKHAFRSFVTAQQATLITKKPVTPSAEEIALNPRARSAKLRIIEKHEPFVA